jgi:hypothetical protein
VVTGDKKEVKSNCYLQCPFKYGSAKKSTKASPCTNIPIKCSHCPETIWKYNVPDHITSQHRPLLDNADLDPSFILEIQLGDMEEKAMGIPDEYITEYRLKYPGLFPQGEDRAAIEAGVQGAQVGKKRHRY